MQGIGFMQWIEGRSPVDSFISMVGLMKTCCAGRVVIRPYTDGVDGWGRSPTSGTTAIAELELVTDSNLRIGEK
ncbi:MAG: hypothetical protein ACFE0J_12330 [Elainellaceae cyanobacterium]